MKRFVRRKSISLTISLSFFFSSEGREQRERGREKSKEEDWDLNLLFIHLDAGKGRKERDGGAKIRMSAKRICLSLFLKLTISRSLSALDDHANGSKERERKNTYLDRKKGRERIHTWIERKGEKEYTLGSRKKMSWVKECNQRDGEWKKNDKRIMRSKTVGWVRGWCKGRMMWKKERIEWFHSRIERKEKDGEKEEKKGEE